MQLWKAKFGNNYESYVVLLGLDAALPQHANTKEPVWQSPRTLGRLRLRHVLYSTW